MELLGHLLHPTVCEVHGLGACLVSYLLILQPQFVQALGHAQGVVHGDEGVTLLEGVQSGLEDGSLGFCANLGRWHGEVVRAVCWSGL